MAELVQNVPARLPPLLVALQSSCTNMSGWKESMTVSSLIEMLNIWHSQLTPVVCSIAQTRLWIGEQHKLHTENGMRMRSELSQIRSRLDQMREQQRGSDRNQELIITCAEEQHALARGSLIGWETLDVKLRTWMNWCSIRAPSVPALIDLANEEMALGHQRAEQQRVHRENVMGTRRRTSAALVDACHDISATLREFVDYKIGLLTETEHHMRTTFFEEWTSHEPRLRQIESYLAALHREAMLDRSLPFDIQQLAALMGNVIQGYRQHFDAIEGRFSWLDTRQLFSSIRLVMDDIYRLSPFAKPLSSSSSPGEQSSSSSSHGSSSHPSSSHRSSSSHGSSSHPSSSHRSSSSSHGSSSHGSSSHGSSSHGSSSHGSSSHRSSSSHGSSSRSSGSSSHRSSSGTPSHRSSSSSSHRS